MLVSKPNIKTLFSLLVFLAVDFGLLAYLYLVPLQELGAPFYLQLLMGILGLVALIILWKIVGAYKILSIQKKKIKVRYPLRTGSFESHLNNLVNWQETIIKTNNTQFKELKMKFEPDNVVKISLQENTNYGKVLDFLKRNAPKKELKQKSGGQNSA